MINNYMKPKHFSHKLSKEQKQQIVDLYKNGISVSDIAPLFNITTSNIFYILKRTGTPCTGVYKANRTFSTPNATKIDNNLSVCDYGCGLIAQYIFNNGKICCSDNPNRCPGKVKRIKITQNIINEETGLTPKQLAASKSLETRKKRGITKLSQIKGGHTRRQSGFYKKLQKRMKNLWDQEPWRDRIRSYFKHYKDTNIPYQGSYEYNFLCSLESQKGIEWIKNNVKRGPSIKYIYMNEEHLYLPDFLIENNIYEIKSKYTWKMDKEKNCKKIEKCIELGYNVIIVINKKEMNYEQARLI